MSEKKYSASVKLIGHGYATAYKNLDKINDCDPDYKGDGISIWKEPNNKIKISLIGHNMVEAELNLNKKDKQPDFKGDGVAVWVHEIKEKTEVVNPL